MALAYQLTFAGIPFCSDKATAYHMAFRGHHEIEDPRSIPPKDQQSLADLIDEIDRKYPFRYLDDFGLSSNFLNRNLAGIANKSLPGIYPNPSIPIGTWYYPTDAKRWSVFRGLTTSSMAKAMLAATKGNTFQPFVMMQTPITPNPQSSYLLKSNMYMLPPRPLAEQGGQFDGFYLITLVDERYFWQYASATFHITSSTTWASLINQLASLLNVSITFSPISSAYTSPEVDSPLWTNAENPAYLLDAIAYNTGRVVVRALNGTYKLETPFESQIQCLSGQCDARTVVRIAGGDIFNSGIQKLPIGDLTPSRNSIIPANVNVTFPKYIAGDDPVPHFLNPRQPTSVWFEDSYGDTYSQSVPIASGNPTISGSVLPMLSGLVGISGYSLTVHSTAKALYSGEIASTPYNQSGLTALAMQTAADYYVRQIIALDEVYPGTTAWTPEGIHDIVWTYSERNRLASTRVLKRMWNQTIGEMQQATPALSGYTSIPKGVGGPTVAQTIRDSFSGSISTSLTQTMNLNDSVAHLASLANLPTQNRWRGKIDNEVMLFEGTSGTNPVSIVYRGIDSTVQVSHNNVATVSLVTPDIQYGVNLTTYEKGQFTYPHEATSGGIQGVHVVPQIQNVYAFSASGVLLNGINHYSGAVNIYDSTKQSGSQFVQQELAWIVERNGAAINSGSYYEGQYAGISPVPVAPVYCVNNLISVPLTSGSTGILHNLLSPTHPDTKPYSPPVRGDLVVGTTDGGIVQRTNLAQLLNQDTSLAQQDTFTFRNPPTVGNTIIILVWCDLFTDNDQLDPNPLSQNILQTFLPNSPVMDALVEGDMVVPAGSEGNVGSCYILRLNVLNTPTGPATFTIRSGLFKIVDSFLSVPIIGRNCGAIAIEVAGLLAPPDTTTGVQSQGWVTNFNGHHSPNTPTNPTLDMTAMTETDFVIAVLAGGSVGITSTGTITQPPGFTNVESLIAPTNSSSSFVACGQVIAGYVGPSTLNWTVFSQPGAPGSTIWSCVAVAYKTIPGVDFFVRWEKFSVGLDGQLIIADEFTLPGMRWANEFQVINNVYNINIATIINNNLTVNNNLFVTQAIVLQFYEFVNINPIYYTNPTTPNAPFIFGNASKIALTPTAQTFIPGFIVGLDINGNPILPFDGQLLYVFNNSNFPILLLDERGGVANGQFWTPDGQVTVFFILNPWQEITIEWRSQLGWIFDEPDIFLTIGQSPHGVIVPPSPGLVPDPPVESVGSPIRILTNDPNEWPENAWKTLAEAGIGGSDWMAFRQAGKWYVAGFAANAVGPSLTLTNFFTDATGAAVYAAPFIVPSGGSTTAIGYFLSAGNTNAALGIYKNTTTPGLLGPGKLMVQGVTGPQTTTTFQMINVAATFVPGEMYWLAILFKITGGATVSVQSIGYSVDAISNLAPWNWCPGGFVIADVNKANGFGFQHTGPASPGSQPYCFRKGSIPVAWDGIKPNPLPQDWEDPAAGVIGANSDANFHNDGTCPLMAFQFQL